MRTQIILLVAMLSGGCQAFRTDSFRDGEGYDLLAAARQIHVGDSRQQAMHSLGWRRDQAFVEAAYPSADDGGNMIHPRLNIWHWQSYPISLEVGFGEDGRVWRVWYYDDSIKPCERIILTAPDNPTERTELTPLIAPLERQSSPSHH